MRTFKYLVMCNLYDRINKTENGCWEFTGALRSGYGAIKYKGKTCATHRVSYEISNGNIPNGLLVCHKCDNRKCINPEHLFLGTYSENMQDCKNKGRIVIPAGKKFKKGNYPINSVFTLDEALIIKEKVKNRGKQSLISISKQLNIPYQYARDISCGRILKER